MSDVLQTARSPFSNRYVPQRNVLNMCLRLHLYNQFLRSSDEMNVRYNLIVFILYRNIRITTKTPGL